jgi:SAM-dependent methyltransferase
VTSLQPRLDDAGFEARYRADPDPWRYETSSYERDKYQATLGACGPGTFDSAVELGGSIGVFSALLAPRCLRLTTVDCSPTAVGQARARLAHHVNARAIVGRIPQELPVGRVDLIVASEVLYYLTGDELDATIGWACSALKPGGRLVCVHWRPSGPERPLSAEQAHTSVAAAPILTKTVSASTADYLLDVFQHR